MFICGILYKRKQSVKLLEKTNYLKFIGYWGDITINHFMKNTWRYAL